MIKAGNPNWKKGESAHPQGRPRGSRSIAIEIIFKVFEEDGKEGFEKKMRDKCKKDPVGYYEEYIEPIQPKEAKMEVSGMGGEPLIIQLEIPKSAEKL